MLVHEMLLQGDEGLRFFDWAEPSSPVAPGAEGAEGHPLASLASQVKATAERAFFDALAEGLRQVPPHTHRLAALLLDARAQLAGLLRPSAGPGARMLLAELAERLDPEFINQRLSQAFDPGFLASAFDSLAHFIGQLQAPARQAEMQRRYTGVAQRFAAARAAGGAAPPPQQQQPDSALVISSRSSSSSGGGTSETVRVQLMPTAAGGVSVTLGAPVSTQQRPPGQVGRSGLSEGMVEATVEAARFIHAQLGQLHGDVAKARLSMLKEVVVGSGTGVEYERQRLERAVEGRPPREALPLTFAWLRETLAASQPPPGLAGSRRVAAVVAAGVLRLVQRPTALAPRECPETLLLDAGRIVQIQNEMQRICLLAVSLLIAQQILLSQRLRLPPAQAQAFAQRLVHRMGVLLSAPGMGLDSLALELHAALTQALPSAGAPSGGSPGSGSSLNGRSSSSGQPGPADDLARPSATAAAPPPPPSAATGPLLGVQPPSPGSSSPGQPTIAAPSSSSSTTTSASIDPEVVRRMVARHFSVEDPVYLKVQAAVGSAALKLFTGQGEGVEECTRVLRGVGTQVLAAEVVGMARGVERIAAVSAGVSGPFYAAMLQELEQARGV